MIITDKDWLKQKCREIDFKNPDDTKKVQANIVILEKELSESRIPGVGLCAIQTGEPIRLSIIRIPKNDKR
jgi:peptide deformylase